MSVKKIKAVIDDCEMWIHYPLLAMRNERTGEQGCLWAHDMPDVYLINSNVVYLINSNVVETLSQLQEANKRVFKTVEEMIGDGWRPI